MAKIDILNLKGEKVKDLTLNDKIWNIEINEVVLKDAIILSQASLRQGTHSTKTRAEVRGGGRKPWRQKGTGRARQGSIRTPHWPGGGIAFGPKPRSYDIKQNKKERRLALLSALSTKYKNNELMVVENFGLESNKTKEFNAILKNLKIDKTSLIITSLDNENLFLATRNNRKLAVLLPNEINVLSIIANNNLIIDEAGVKALEEVLK